MISATNVSLRYGGRTLFEDVNISFSPGNCYGIIGANGAGKSTFLKILSGEIEPQTGSVQVTPGERVAVLKQDHFAYDEYAVLETVIMGHERLYAIMKEKDALYAKPDFNDEDGIRVSELEGEFADLNGWEAESEAGSLLQGLGIGTDLHEKLMRDMEDTLKVRVLLAQALFGNPGVLLLDEPTNHLDMDSIDWLEEFLYQFENTVLVVSHDRHFLNRVCTYTADIDHRQIKLYVGNYDFWYQSSQLALSQVRDANKKKEDKIADLKAFIQRFSSNASKARQATARKKMLDKLVLEDIVPSSRKYPYIHFKPDREIGKDVLYVEDLSIAGEDGGLVHSATFRIMKNEKVVFTGNPLALTALFDALTGDELEGHIKWGQTTSVSYFPKEHDHFFENDLSLVDWMRQWAKEGFDDDNYLRGFLGRMLFSGDEASKKANVLSGGEKVRCMFARMMMSGANVLIFDEPTNHLDLESITALNTGLAQFPGCILFTTHDHELAQTVCSRVIEIGADGQAHDYLKSFDEYLEIRHAAVS
ncbi:MAG: ATP-binding cassette domain-containing protein [Acidobacteria bacterium]|nr:ATP-binding cassette domain-containing protein [Acidobacteriota bacterium]